MSKNNNFNKLGLPAFLLNTLEKLGYENPTKIQEESIPDLLQGTDLLALAQTGTGKTAAFALPILANIDPALKAPQAIIITPTRELAIQVAEAFQSYAKGLNNFYVTPIYGGQAYNIQLKALKRGSHIIVGTPGRIKDHLERGTLKTKNLKTLVLDEADEMLNMGFINDIEWILAQIPHQHQTALFSATMHKSIQKISSRFLNNPKKIHIKPKTVTVDAIQQDFIKVQNNQKLDVLTRFLEVESIEAAIIFVRTKNLSTELAEKLQARGLAASALNGDIDQSLRKKVVEQLKKGHLDFIVATDVAARGIDVERVTHVINYDIPTNSESYIHRIGRTGRAGRKGKALSFITPREFRLLRDIEKTINKKIRQIQSPTVHEVHQSRKQQLKEKVTNALSVKKTLKPYFEVIEDLVENTTFSEKEIGAALAYINEKNNPIADFRDVPAKPNKKRKPKRKSRASN